MLWGEVDPKSRTQRPWADSQVRDNSPRPLERRVSFCEPCAGTVSGPDEPRKSFMKFCETDNILTSKPRSYSLDAIHLTLFISRRPAEHPPCPLSRRLLQLRCAGWRYPR